MSIPNPFLTKHHRAQALFVQSLRRICSRNWCPRGPIRQRSDHAIIPIPMDAAGAANQASQQPADLILPGFLHVLVPVARGASLADSPYDLLLTNFSIVQAGVRAE